jgi:hypothetical protein
MRAGAETRRHEDEFAGRRVCPRLQQNLAGVKQCDLRARRGPASHHNIPIRRNLKDIDTKRRQFVRWRAVFRVSC